MSATERQRLIKRLSQKLLPRHRLVPMWAQLRVWRRGADGQAHPAELLPRLYGGVYDRLLKRYVRDAKPGPGEVHEIPVHPGQLPLVLHPGGKLRVMAFGGPGSGKTRAAVIWLVLAALTFPGKAFGNVGATGERTLRMVEAHHEVVPSAWVDEESEHQGKRKHLWANGSRHDFRAAKEPSHAIGTPIQGVSWWRAVIDETQNVSDRAQRDVDERGRSAGGAYMIIETATNVDDLPGFAVKREEYKHAKNKQILRLNPMDNPWVELEYWDLIRENYTERQWRQRILSEDLEAESRTYYAFNFGVHVRPRPRQGDPEYVEITRQKTAERGAEAREAIAGVDFGVLVNAAEMVRAYRHLPTRQVHWWVTGEITGSLTLGTGGFARQVVKAVGGDPEDVVVYADPHVNTRDTDKSDIAQFRQRGIETHPAGAPPIRVKHRVEMLNVLFDRCVLFIDTVDGSSAACAPRLVQSLLTMQVDEQGNLEPIRKNGEKDPSHWPAALAYGLYPWNRIRGLYVVDDEDEEEDPVLRKAREIAKRREARG